MSSNTRSAGCCCSQSRAASPCAASPATQKASNGCNSRFNRSRASGSSSTSKIRYVISALLGLCYRCRQQQMRLIFCRAGVQLQAGLLAQHRQPGTDIVVRHAITRRTATVGAGINNAQTPAFTLRLQLNTDITAFNSGLDTVVNRVFQQGLQN